jgi:hypothetical protein
MNIKDVDYEIQSVEKIFIIWKHKRIWKPIAEFYEDFNFVKT